MKTGYTNVRYAPGSLYKRFHLTNFQKMNRNAVRAYKDAVAAAGPLMFNATLTQSQGLSELAAQQLLVRVQQEAQAKSASITNLGALMNKSV